MTRWRRKQEWNKFYFAFLLRQRMQKICQISTFQPRKNESHEAKWRCASTEERKTCASFPTDLSIKEKTSPVICLRRSTRKRKCWVLGEAVTCLIWHFSFGTRPEPKQPRETPSDVFFKCDKILTLLLSTSRCFSLPFKCLACTAVCASIRSLSGHQSSPVFVCQRFRYLRDNLPFRDVDSLFYDSIACKLHNYKFNLNNYGASEGKKRNKYARKDKLNGTAEI